MKHSKTKSKGIEIFLFLVSLIFMCWFIGSLYYKNYNKIFDGTYVYDRFETPMMMSPLLMVFLVFLYLGVKIYEKITKDNQSFNSLD